MSIKKSFTVSEPLIDLSVSCNVAILQGDSGIVNVQIDGDDVDKDFAVSQEQQKIKIVQKNQQSGGGNVIIGDMIMGRNVIMSNSGGVSITTSGGTTYITGGSGRVVVNGVEVDTSGKVSGGKPYNPPQITLYIPVNSSLDATLSGSSKIGCEVALDDAYISAKGSVTAVLSSAKTLDCQVSGSADVKAKLTGGALTLQCSGSADIDITGKWSSAVVNVSGCKWVWIHSSSRSGWWSYS